MSVVVDSTSAESLPVGPKPSHKLRRCLLWACDGVCAVARGVRFATANLASPNPCGPETSIQGLVALYSLLIIQLGAAVLAEQEKGKRVSYIALYTLLGLATVIAMAMIVGSVTKEGDGKDGIVMYKHVFGPGTVRVGKWIIAASLVTLVGFFCAGASGFLPNQSGYAPKVSSFSEINDGDGALPRIGLQIPISPYHFGNGSVPYNFEVATSINGEELATKWKLENAQIYVVDPAGKTNELTKPNRQRFDDRTDKYGMEITGAFEPKATYILQLIFRPGGKLADDYENKSQAGAMSPEDVQKFIASFTASRTKALKGIKNDIVVTVKKN
jgi:hypothetical protein